MRRLKTCHEMNEDLFRNEKTVVCGQKTVVRGQKIMRRQKVVAQLGTLITLQCHVVHDSTGIHTSLINPTDGDRYVLLRFENLLVNPMNDCPR